MLESAKGLTEMCPPRVASQEIRNRRRVMRYRNLLVWQSVQMKNRVGCMLMETGISYNKQKLHQRRYFNQLLKERANELPSSMPELLRLSRSTIDGLGQMNKQLLRALQTDEALGARGAAAHDHSWSWAGIIPNLGTGDGRYHSLSIYQRRNQLLRPMRSGAEFCRKKPADASIEAAQ
jgi:hypothetical protein